MKNVGINRLSKVKSIMSLDSKIFDRGEEHTTKKRKVTRINSAFNFKLNADCIR